MTHGIASQDLYHDLVNKLRETGVVVTGHTVKFYQRALNEAILDIALDAVNGASLPPAEAHLVKESLTRGSRALALKDMLLGTINNGALRRLDWDSTVSGDPSDKYAYLAPIPTEALRVTSRELTIKLGIQRERPNTDVKVITLEYYDKAVQNPTERPDENVAWVLEHSAYTSAGNNTLVIDWDAPIPNITENSLTGIKGKNKMGDPISHSGRIDQIVTAKGYDPILYRIHYYVMPTFIIIDEKDRTNAVNCTFHPALRNLLVNRAADIAMRILAGGRSQQQQPQQQ